ncbi:ATP-binding cassette domain-containing protein [Bacteriovorax sp. DB6_IX]|uniref:ATP-binding cassette domain-containing protein n=1 Tax=Bacteriovorax sp. DB6_IX TaxID=1353530 RepID=UPI000389E261|nr:ATP-binding cassette domain-containing protein [Bacteriovorax sp. DB6_IX]EQC51386.1 ABC transporter, ATP-binding protein [Bacteriovorax sp. DB6_IX]
MLEVNKLSFSYSDKQVFKDFSLKLESGEKVFLDGANGAGKTTLIKLICGLILLEKGEIKVDGLIQDGKNLELNRLLGLSPAEENSFVYKLTGLENLQLFARLYEIDLDKKLREYQILTEVGNFSQALETPYYLCSSGMKKSLSLFRSVMHGPKLILWDEPFANIDKESREKITAWMKDSEAAIVFSNHEVIEGSWYQRVEIG